MTRHKSLLYDDTFLPDQLGVAPQASQSGEFSSELERDLDDVESQKVTYVCQQIDHHQEA